jgi:acyl-CoA thioesterase FadM
MSNLVYENKKEISSAFIDSSVRLGTAQTTVLVQDNVTECFKSFDCDGVTYKKKYNAFWVFSKAKFKFFSRPAWNDFVTVKTFPINNSGIRTNINTQIIDSQGKPVANVKQEACVLSFENHRPVKLSNVEFPAEGFPDPVLDEPFERFPSDFTEDEFVYDQVIRYCHIDMSHHMNNCEYVRLALSVFSEEYLLAHELTEMEVHYTGESREGQTLKIYRRDCADCPGKTYVHIKEGERCVFECCLIMRS